MDEAIDEFKRQLPSDVADVLDWSPDSLDTLEEWILKNYPSTEAMLKGDNGTIVDGAGRYVGEVLRRSLGGFWDIELDNKKDVFFELPILAGFEGASTPLSPLSLVTASADRRTGNFLSSILTNMTYERRGNIG